eukprot:TRINITY_DN1735_c1_g1_i1.p1 TRINITY_DN1735_c1_g1~~TRINITY_DN1735_c1_g1_i1.p1  ORF type:complete len:384 (-),score=42.06 TRINITY_DN1735_c1_g1_i1:107-1258(-)
MFPATFRSGFRAKRHLLSKCRYVWTASAAPEPRSSHAVTSLHRDVNTPSGSKREGAAYVFGGEDIPRRAFDSRVHRRDSSGVWTVSDVGAPSPAPLLGCGAVGIGQALYVFGGRTGGTVCFDQDPNALATNESSVLMAFDVEAERWEIIDAPGPPARSFHTMAVVQDKLVVFGGCGVKGRLNDLWQFDPLQKSWSLLHDGSGDSSPHAKGGSSLLPLPGFPGDMLLLFGFNGDQLGEVHHFDASSKTWRDVTAQQGGDVPSPRSVFAAASRKAPNAGAPACEVFVLGGELEPSDQGHEGAGAFTDEAYTLTVSRTTDTEFKYSWQRGVCGDLATQRLTGEARGWHAATIVTDSSQGDTLVAYGGLTAANVRLGETQLLSLPGR